MPRTLSFIEAIIEALDLELGRDERVFLLGEDIGPSGGVFGATAGLWKKYGEERVLDTPLAEGIIIAAAIGHAPSDARRSSVGRASASSSAAGFNRPPVADARCSSSP